MSKEDRYPRPRTRRAPSSIARGQRYYLGRINLAASEGKPVRLAMTLAENLGKLSIARAKPVNSTIVVKRTSATSASLCGVLIGLTCVGLLRGRRGAAGVEQLSSLRWNECPISVRYALCHHISTHKQYDAIDVQTI